VIVLVVAAEIFIEDYYPSLSGNALDNSSVTSTDDISLPDDLDFSQVIETNVLGSDIDYSQIPGGSISDIDDLLGEDLDEIIIDPTEKKTNSPFIEPGDGGPAPQNHYDVPDFEDETYFNYESNVYIREDMIKSAGFLGGFLEDEPTDGYLYKNIYIGDLEDVEVSKVAIRTEDKLMAKIYVMKMGPLASVNEVYELLKVRSGQDLDTTINETNEYGDLSFYMNDANRPQVAFLTVRFGPVVYGFSYLKDYHAQVKNLTTLIDLEF